jgi:prepilin-type processing-associated H-X9-DG protein
LQTNSSYTANTIILFICPSDPRNPGVKNDGWGFTDYAGIEGTTWGATGANQGVINTLHPIKIAAITDGTSNTIMVGEHPYAYDAYEGGWGWWADGGDWDTTIGSANTSTHFSGNYNKGLNGQACGPTPFYFGNGPKNVADPCSFNQLWSNHPGGGNFTFADGSVRWIDYTAKLIVVNLSTYAGAETDNTFE